MTRAACIVGVAPYDVLGEDWFDGMDPANVKEFGWALESEERVTAETTREAAAMIARMTEDPATRPRRLRDPGGGSCASSAGRTSRRSWRRR